MLRCPVWPSVSWLQFCYSVISLSVFFFAWSSLLAIVLSVNIWYSCIVSILLFSSLSSSSTQWIFVYNNVYPSVRMIFFCSCTSSPTVNQRRNIYWNNWIHVFCSKIYIYLICCIFPCFSFCLFCYDINYFCYVQVVCILSYSICFLVASNTLMVYIASVSIPADKWFMYIRMCISPYLL